MHHSLLLLISLFSFLNSNTAIGLRFGSTEPFCLELLGTPQFRWPGLWNTLRFYNREGEGWYQRSSQLDFMLTFKEEAVEVNHGDSCLQIKLITDDIIKGNWKRKVEIQQPGSSMRKPDFAQSRWEAVLVGSREVLSPSARCSSYSLFVTDFWDVCILQITAFTIQICVKLLWN